MSTKNFASSLSGSENHCSQRDELPLELLRIHHPRNQAHLAGEVTAEAEARVIATIIAAVMPVIGSIATIAAAEMTRILEGILAARRVATTTITTIAASAMTTDTIMMIRRAVDTVTRTEQVGMMNALPLAVMTVGLTSLWGVGAV